MATWPTGIINLMFIPIISPIWKALQDRRTRIAELNSNSFLANLGNQTISEWVKNKLDEAEEKRIQLWENPPLCGSVVRYAQKCGHDDAHGEFLFKTADVEQALRDSLQENPHLTNSDDGAMLRWVQRRDDSLTKPSDVPSIWSRFKYVANDLVRAGKAEIHCRQCNATIESHQIATNDDSGRPGWNYDRVVCPHGHDLLVVESVHLMSN